MTNCKHMTNERTCGLKSNAYRHRCYGEDKCRHCKPMTNADRIRAMNDEELHDFLCNLAEYGWLSEHNGVFTVTHWTPLPKAPETKKTKEE